MVSLPRRLVEPSNAQFSPLMLLNMFRYRVLTLVCKVFCASKRLPYISTIANFGTGNWSCWNGRALMYCLDIITVLAKADPSEGCEPQSRRSSWWYPSTGQKRLFEPVDGKNSCWMLEKYWKSSIGTCLFHILKLNQHRKFFGLLVFTLHFARTKSRCVPRISRRFRRSWVGHERPDRQGGLAAEPRPNLGLLKAGYSVSKSYAF